MRSSQNFLSFVTLIPFTAREETSTGCGGTNFDYVRAEVLRSSKRDWEYRGRPGTQQYTYPGVNCYLESPSDGSPANSLPTPPPPPLVAPPPPPPPPRRPRRSVTFAESPPKSPKKKSPKYIFQRKLSIAALDVAVPWTPASPRHWSGLNDKPEYIT